MAFTSNYKLRDIPHLRGGLNNRYNNSEIEDIEMSDMENIEVDSKLIRSAAGYVDYGGDTGPFWGGFHAKFEDGTNVLIRQRQDILEYDDGDGGWTACTLPTEGSPTANVNITQTACSFAMLNDTIIWSNGVDEPLSSTDGITWTEATTGSPAETLPKATVLFNNGNNRILYMGIPTEPSKIYWSDINEPTTIGSSSYQFVGKNDGAEIMDAVLLPNGAMLLLKTDRFYAISDITADMIAVDPIGFAPCVRYTAVSTENSAIWAGPKGEIYEFNGSVANLISDNIEELDITKPYNMRGVYSKNQYRLAVPNSTDDYNSYEYVVNRQNRLEKLNNPYAITKNQRYIGCYIKEDREVSDIRRTRLYFGDSRSDATGSPAEVPTTFAYINETHDSGVTQGLNGVAQDCYFVTRFFTEDLTFFIKRYTKFFMRMQSDSDQEITLSYRSDTYAQWTDVVVYLDSDDLDFVLEDDDEGGFDEGYSFSYKAIDNVFKDLETTGREVRGIQFKLSWSSINDVEILSQAYKMLIKNNFH
jgi:hypothetical protein